MPREGSPLEPGKTEVGVASVAVSLVTGDTPLLLEGAPLEIGKASVLVPVVGARLEASSGVVDGCGKTGPIEEPEAGTPGRKEVGTESVRLPVNEADPLGLSPGTMVLRELEGPAGNIEVCSGGV